MKIDFYHIDAFEVPNYEPIWRALRDMGVEANLVAVPNEKNVAGKWFDFDRFQSYCSERGLPFATEREPNADLAVTTQNADILREYRCPRVRMMYGPTVYPKAWGLQPHSVKPFDAVLTHGKLYTDYYSTWLRKDQLPIVGYPRYDDFFAGKLSRKNIRQRWGVNDQKPVLVFLPTWADNTAFDTFFPALMDLTDRYQIILRPHHCTLRLEPQRMALLKASGLLILENAFDLAEAYAGADVVLSDVRSGGAFESCLCGVPTVGMVKDAAELSGWLAQHNIGQIISLCAQPQQLDVAIQVALTSQSRVQACKRWVEERVAYRDGSSGKQAAHAIVELVQKKARSITIPVAAPVLGSVSHLLTPVFKTNLEKN